MQHIIEELKRRKRLGELCADTPLSSVSKYDLAPLTTAQLAAAQQRLGFALPELLRRIYTEVSNGGLGYSYGLMGLVGGMLNEDRLDAVSQYLRYREPRPKEKDWAWPKGLLPFGHLGCAMYHCVKCEDPAHPVLWFEPNPIEEGQSWNDAFIPFAPSLTLYFETWLAGRDLFEVFAPGAFDEQG